MSTTEQQAAVELHVTMPDGSVWAVPAHLIAHNRATYYAEDGYQEEYDYTMGDDAELEDWAANNMNWSDVAAHARKVEQSEPVDYQEGWVNGEKLVVRTAEGRDHA
jgi:hypothetical protein